MAKAIASVSLFIFIMSSLILLSRLSFAASPQSLLPLFSLVVKHYIPRLPQPRATGGRCWFHSQESQPPPNNAITSAKNTISILANSSRCWSRLEHVVELALLPHHHSSLVVGEGETTTTTTTNGRTVVDIGTDHGMLAMALAGTGVFQKVTGVDVSRKALEGGALRLQKMLLFQKSRTMDELKTLQKEELVEFRCGDGLTVLQPGEADTACIAGVGASTMVDILSAKYYQEGRNVNDSSISSSTSSSTSSTSSDRVEDMMLLDYLRCHHLVLQPASSRPRYLCMLYQTLFDVGWIPMEERIQFLAGRWYISASFHRRLTEAITNDNNNEEQDYRLPGSLLFNVTDHPKCDPKILQDYLDHHRHWMKSLLQYPGAGLKLGESEKRWLSYFDQKL